MNTATRLHLRMKTLVSMKTSYLIWLPHMGFKEKQVVKTRRQLMVLNLITSFDYGVVETRSGVTNCNLGLI